MSSLHGGTRGVFAWSEQGSDGRRSTAYRSLHGHAAVAASVPGALLRRGLPLAPPLTWRFA